MSSLLVSAAAELGRCVAQDAFQGGDFGRRLQRRGDGGSRVAGVRSWTGRAGGNAAANENVFQILGPDPGQLPHQTAVDHQHAGAAVVQEILVIVRLQIGVQGDRDRAGFHGAEEAESKFGRVRQQEHHPFFGAHVPLPQGVAKAVDVLVQIAVGDNAVAAQDGGFRLAAGGLMRIDKDRRRVQPLRKLE